MKNYLSVKYKLIFILALTVIITLLGYYLLATNLFEEDKVAYVYSTILNQVSSREHEFNIVLKNQSEILEEYASLIRLGNDQGVIKILENRKDVLFFSYKKYNFHYEKVGQFEKMSHLVSAENFQFDIKNRTVLIKKKFGLDDECEIIFKADQLFDMKDAGDDRLAFFISRSENDSSKESDLIKAIRQKIINKRLHSGVKEISDSKMVYLLSFTQISHGLYYVLGIPKDSALSGIIELKEKSFIYFMGLVSIVGFFSIIISNKFTLPILELTEKVLLFGDGKFEVRSNLKTSDELGQMANVFNEMAMKISNLVEEVRVYSTQLEGIVAQRTAALRKALGLQKAMINSLDQGFFIVNSKLLVMETYSKSAEKIFGNELSGIGVEKILKFKQFDESSTKLLFKNMFSESIPFESMVGIAPKMIHTGDGKSIFLEYEAVRNKEEKIVGIVIIATDKTESLRLEKESELDKSKVAMILKIMNNQYSFTKLLAEVRTYIDKINSSSDFISKDEAFRFAHTMKGCFLLFHMKKLALQIHEIEDEIKSMHEGENLSVLAMKLCSVIDNELNAMATEFPSLFGGVGWKESKAIKSFFESDLIELVEQVKNNFVTNVEQYLIERLIYVPFEDLVVSLKEDVFTHAKNVGKEISEFKVKGGEIRVNPADFSIHLQYLLHLTRNCIDHGIEAVEVRREKGKDVGGHILIELKMHDENWYELSVLDDGKGLDAKVLREKADLLGIDHSMLNEEDVYQLIFYSGFSTAETETETSGRGIGMSAIKKYVDDLHGKILIETITGSSLKITLLLPKEIKIVD